MNVLTHLMFQDGLAHEAVARYVAIVPDSRIDEKVGPDGTGQAIRFTLAGRPFLAFDSRPMHDFGFTPATSIYLECDSREQVDEIFEQLADGGAELMPRGEYPFSPWYGWCVDRSGVSWQVGVTAQ